MCAIITAMYVPGFAAMMLPAEKVQLAQQTFLVSMWYQNSGIVAASLLGLMLLLQLAFWQLRKRLLLWPALLSGCYLIGFASSKLLALVQLPSPVAGSLAHAISASVSAMPALWLLLAGGIALLLVPFSLRNKTLAPAQPL